jgi:hypothetical protein
MRHRPETLFHPETHFVSGVEDEKVCMFGINRLVSLRFGRELALSVLAKFRLKTKLGSLQYAWTGPGSWRFVANAT